MGPWLLLSLLVLVLDQWSKLVAEQWLIPYRPIEVTSWFHLTLMYNEGAAFSFLSDAGGWQRWILAGLAILMSLVLTVWLFRLKAGERLLAPAIALVIGGALGNLVDRLLTGAVVDFVQLYLAFVPLAIFNPWPAFNIADSAISIGVVMLFFASLRNDN